MTCRQAAGLLRLAGPPVALTAWRFPHAVHLIVILFGLDVQVVHRDGVLGGRRRLLLLAAVVSQGGEAENELLSPPTSISQRRPLAGCTLSGSRGACLERFAHSTPGTAPSWLGLRRNTPAWAEKMRAGALQSRGRSQ
jgi:hypothetical protein